MRRILSFVVLIVFLSNTTFCQQIPAIQDAKEFVFAQKKSKIENCAFEFAPWQAVESQNCQLNKEKFRKNKETTRLYAFFPIPYTAQHFYDYMVDNTVLVSANTPQDFRNQFKHELTDKNFPAVIICPGGSYHHLGMKHEGYQVARWFTQQGYAAFVLRYRVSSHRAHHPDMIQDLQLAIAMLKQYADAWYIDTTAIGAIGFSAGGHLVLHSGITHDNFIEKELPTAKNYGLRPNYIMSIYPVVSMEDSIAHQKSRKNLLTKKYTESDIHQFCIEQYIPEDLPPTFVLACTDDNVVDVRNSRALWQALNNKQINFSSYAELPTGGHGFGMYKNNSEATKDWNERLLKNWLDMIPAINQYPYRESFDEFFNKKRLLVMPDEN